MSNTDLWGKVTPTINLLIRPHGILVDILNAIEHEDTDALESIRNKVSHAPADDSTAQTMKVSLLQFIDRLATILAHTIQNEELAKSQQEVLDLEDEKNQLQDKIDKFDTTLDDFKQSIANVINDQLLPMLDAE